MRSSKKPLQEVVAGDVDDLLEQCHHMADYVALFLSLSLLFEYIFHRPSTCLVKSVPLSTLKRQACTTVSSRTFTLCIFIQD